MSRFYPSRKAAVRAFDQGQIAVKTSAAGGVSVIAGIQQDLWDVFAGQWFRRLKNELPKAELRLTCDYSDVLCEHVARGLLDIAIVFQPTRLRGFHLEPLVRLSVVLVSDRPSKWGGRLPENYYYVDWGEKATFQDEVVGGGFVNGDQFTEAVYRSLSRAQ